MKRIFEYDENSKTILVKRIDEADYMKMVHFMKDIDKDKFTIKDNGKLLLIHDDKSTLYGILKNGLVAELSGMSAKEIEEYNSMEW